MFSLLSALYVCARAGMCRVRVTIGIQECVIRIELRFSALPSLLRYLPAPCCPLSSNPEPCALFFFPLLFFFLASELDKETSKDFIIET